MQNQGYVRIFDTTLRDGEQTPGVHFTAKQKVDIARRLEDFGVDTVEAGFPASSPGDFTAVRAVAEAVTRCEVAALARCVPADIEAAARALQPAARPVIHVVIGTSEGHMRKNGMTRAQTVRRIETSVARARRHVAEVEFSAEDATRSDPVFLRQCVYAAVTAGATRINIADTVGCATPDEFGRLVADIVEFVEGRAIVSAHCHNDLGMATANSVAAVQRGAGQVETASNGLGERAGNACLEEVAVALTAKGIARTGVDVRRAGSLSAAVAEASGVPVQPNRAVVGANAFAHNSGIHQDGIIKDPETYQFVAPALVGAPGHRFVLTARSGRGAIAHVAREHGRELDPDELEAAYAAFIARADDARGAVSESEVLAIIGEVTRARPRGAAM